MSSWGIWARASLSCWAHQDTELSRTQSYVGKGDCSFHQPPILMSILGKGGGRGDKHHLIATSHSKASTAWSLRKMRSANVLRLSYPIGITVPSQRAAGDENIYLSAKPTETALMQGRAVEWWMQSLAWMLWPPTLFLPRWINVSQFILSPLNYRQILCLCSF